MTSAIVVDDDYDTVEVFTEFLNLRDIQVLGKAYNGQDGERNCRRFQSDCWWSVMQFLKANHLALFRAKCMEVRYRLGALKEFRDIGGC